MRRMDPIDDGMTMAGLYGRMKQEEQPESERAVWLRYWREADGWRFVIEDPRTHARVAFARADELADFLQREPVRETVATRDLSVGNSTNPPRG